MESSVTMLFYQNLLFAEGLECILQQNNYRVFKKELAELKELTNIQLPHIALTIVEVSWPFPQLENVMDQLTALLSENSKIILIPNIVNKIILRIMSQNKINGIVLKCSSKDELLFGMKQVLEGKTYYASIISNLFLKEKEKGITFTVSKREKQILCLIAEMNTTEEIASKLFITKSTVKTHRRNLMRKFNTKNTFCLLRSACHENLLDSDTNFCECCFKQFAGL